MSVQLMRLAGIMLVVALPMTATATPWPGLPGNSEFSVSYEHTQYDDLLSAEGTIPKGWGVASHAAFIGLSYDPADTVELSIAGGYGESTSTKPGGTTKGLLDTDINVALNLINPFDTEGFGLGLEASYRIPGTYTVKKVPNGIGKRVHAASLEIQFGYRVSTVVLESSIGYRLSTAPAPNDIFGKNTVAWAPVQDLLLAIHHTFQFGQSGPDLGPEVTDLVTLKEEDQTLHAVTGYQILDDVGLSFRFSKTLTGRNAPDATRFGFTMHYSL